MDTLELIVGMQVARHGSEALEIAKKEAERHKAEGNDREYKKSLRLIELTRQELGRLEQEDARKSAIRPHDSPLFAGLTNLTLSESSYEFSDGIRLERVYAHVMAPYLVAFSPAENQQPHPGPWKAVSGGLGLDVTAQVTLEEGVRPTNFDRLNTLWWITSLLRLIHSVGVRVPVVSNVSFLEGAEAKDEPVFWPMELDDRGFAFDGLKKGFELPTVTLDWIGKNFQSGSRLMETRSFNLAYRAMEAAQRASTFSESLTMAWSSIEAVFRPGPKNVTHRVCLALSTFLECDPVARDKLYGEAKRLYAVRGQVVHAAELPLREDLGATFRLARRCLLLAIEKGCLPEFDQLEASWKARV